MLSWKLGINRFTNRFALKWRLFRPFRRAIVLILILVLLIVVISIWLYPTWIADSKSFLSLLALSIVGVVSFLSGFLQTVAQVILSYQKAEQSYRAFNRVTNKSKKFLSPKLRGIPNFLSREETDVVLNHVINSTPVILTGDAGAGKSAIAVELLKKASEKNIFSLLIDAKTLTLIQNAGDLRAYFDIDESIYEAIQRLGEFIRVVLIIDQLDNIAGTIPCEIAIELLTACTDFEGVSVVAVSRYRESNEQGAIRPLLEFGFTNIHCQSITDEQIINVLNQIGVDTIPHSIIEIATNLLNLDILCEIVRTTNSQDITNIQDEIDLWEGYRLLLVERETYAAHRGEEFIAEAVRLARIGLQSPDRGFDMDYPQRPIQTRLSSSNVVEKISGRRYQFSHEKLQDYLYAWDACENGTLSDVVMADIGELHARNVIIWMRDIYQRTNTLMYERFLEGVLDG